MVLKIVLPLLFGLTIKRRVQLAKSELKKQLVSYKSYINDIPNVIDPCKMCKFIDENKLSHVDNTDICKKCCWYYDSKFEVGD